MRSGRTLLIGRRSERRGSASRTERPHRGNGVVQVRERVVPARLQDDAAAAEAGGIAELPRLAIDDRRGGAVVEVVALEVAGRPVHGDGLAAKVVVFIESDLR